MILNEARGIREEWDNASGVVLRRRGDGLLVPSFKWEKKEIDLILDILWTIANDMVHIWELFDFHIYCWMILFHLWHFFCICFVFISHRCVVFSL